MGRGRVIYKQSGDLKRKVTCFEANCSLAICLKIVDAGMKGRPQTALIALDFPFTKIDKNKGVFTALR